MRTTVAVALVVTLAACAGRANRATPRSLATPSTSTTAVRATATTTTAPPGAATAEAPCGATTVPPQRYGHVIWIFMENHPRSAVIGNSNAPYETSLAAHCGTATAYSSVGSPSLPNYIGATAGDTFGIADDNGPSAHLLTVDNLFRQVRDAGMSERSYEESMAAPCQLTTAGAYAVRHNPATYYQGDDDRAACQRDDVPLGTVDAGALRTALDSGTLPTFAFVTPDTCSDTHDCSVHTGDDWLAKWLAVILGSTTYREGSTAIFVAWDEDSPMPFIAISPSVAPGTVASDAFDHFALLRATEEMLGLPLLRRAAGANDLRAAFRL